MRRMRRMKTNMPMHMYLREITFRCGDGDRGPFRLPLNSGRSVFLRRRKPSLMAFSERGHGES